MPNPNWSDRKLPGQMKAAWGDRDAVWENEVMLANETGKDLYITIPIDASDDYVFKLANLIRFGSDGVNPYTWAVNNPVYPGLNPNLHVYVEWANEIWNWAFSQSNLGVDMPKLAVQNNTLKGKIINYDGQRPDGDFRRWAALRRSKASNIFRAIWGDAAMGDSVRVVLEYQYDNRKARPSNRCDSSTTTSTTATARQHVADPHPVSYYIWVRGGASYFGASNPLGLVNDIQVPDGDLESAPVTSGNAVTRPAGTPWTFTGNAGSLSRCERFGDNQRIAVDGVGAIPTTPSGNQAMFISGIADGIRCHQFPACGMYALDFQSAAEFGADMADALDFYFDGQRVTPLAAEPGAKSLPWVPGTGYGRDPSKFIFYGTVPVCRFRPRSQHSKHRRPRQSPIKPR